MAPLKKIIFALTDIVCVTFALVASIWLKFDSLTPAHTQYLLFVIPILMPIGLAVFWSFGLYNRTMRFISLPDMIAVFFAVSCFSAVKLLSIYFREGFPSLSSVFAIDWMLCLIMLGAVRITPRLLLSFIEISPLRNMLFTKTD
ncbi:MAG: hypothetical protein M0R31_11240, partial [Candidatus Riflebacteria bacterium]|nr:hypothetical protein [Candidatus Riflebacteria bacterium]